MHVARANPPLGLWLLLGGAVALFALSRTQRGQILAADVVERIMSGVRGLRNNNPGNLRRTSIPWLGKIPDAAHAARLGFTFDASYEQFTAPKWGVRALARDLRKDFFRDGQRTVRALINEFAPGHENPTDAYIGNVARALNVAPDEPFDFERLLPQLLAAIIRQENGSQPFSLEELQVWANLA